MSGHAPGGVVDAHHHVWDLTVRDQPWITGPRLTPLRRSFSLDDLRADLRGTPVTATVLVQTVTAPEETPELLALAHAHPLVRGVVGWIDLMDPAVADRLAALRELPGGERLVAVRHQVQEEPDPEWLLRPAVLRGLRAVASAGLAYDLVILSHQLSAATRAAALVPELPFVLDHLAKPPLRSGDLTPWSRDLTAFAALPHTTAKLSGLITEADPTTWTPAALAPATDTALHLFGPHRLMYGSDWPVCRLTADYRTTLSTARTLTADLSAGEHHSVFTATATRVYGLAP